MIHRIGDCTQVGLPSCLLEQWLRSCFLFLGCSSDIYWIRALHTGFHRTNSVRPCPGTHVYKGKLCFWSLQASKWETEGKLELSRSFYPIVKSLGLGLQLVSNVDDWWLQWLLFLLSLSKYTLFFSMLYFVLYTKSFKYGWVWKTRHLLRKKGFKL